MRVDPQRVFDLAVTAAVLPLAAPVMLVVATLVRLAMGLPVLFRHTRTGLHGRLFTLCRFRTMRAGLFGESDEVRLTGVGQFLRSFSFDELPQLWTVLRGDMSIVGPRPLLPQYGDRYTPEQARRHEVHPRITGLVQVSDETRSRGTRNSHWTYGTWIIGASGSTCGYCCALSGWWCDARA